VTRFGRRTSAGTVWVWAASALIGLGTMTCLAEEGKATPAGDAKNAQGATRRSVKCKGLAMDKSCDFGRSFITFVTPGGRNNARIQVEARCAVVDRKTGQREDYYLVASCKGEDTYGKGPLFLEPSYDFCMIYSTRDFRIIRVHGNAQRDNETVDEIAKRFETAHFNIKLVAAEVLADNKAVVAATLANRVLNGRVTFVDPSKRYEATIEFPIKTMNVNANTVMYQVDTGPILVPNWNAEKARWVERFDLAFVAYNKPDDAHFVIQTPTPVVDGDAKGPKVSHYSRTMRQDAKCCVVALGDGG